MNVPLKTYRRDFEHSYAFGVFPTLELLAHRPGEVLGVLVHSRGERNEGIRKVEDICRARGIEIDANDRVVERLSHKENEWAIGVFRKYECALDPRASHVVLVNPSDMGNLGTILRTMAGFGVGDLAIVRPAVDSFDPRVVRASMGALFQVAFAYFDTFDEYSAAFERPTYPFMTDGRLALEQARFQRPFSLVFGSEPAGLPARFHTAGTSVTIRHTRRIDSLNLPTAVGIALYEATKGDFE